jgi:hypothetical protein
VVLGDSGYSAKVPESACLCRRLAGAWLAAPCLLSAPRKFSRSSLHASSFRTHPEAGNLNAACSDPQNPEACRDDMKAAPRFLAQIGSVAFLDDRGLFDMQNCVHDWTMTRWTAEFHPRGCTLPETALPSDGRTRIPRTPPEASDVRTRSLMMLTGD